MFPGQGMGFSEMFVVCLMGLVQCWPACGGPGPAGADIQKTRIHRRHSKEQIMRFWDELSLPWQACMDQAWEAYCDDCFPIGAVVVDKDGKILSRGRNRIYEKQKGGRHLRGAELAHAEVEALLHIDFDAIDPHSCALYTTTEPCPMCMGTFYMSGIRTLHFGSRDPWAGSAEPAWNDLVPQSETDKSLSS